MDINKKVCFDNNVVANCDRISNLPDAILQHIMSFLDIKLAVQTCVLSRRWQYLWTDVPCLNFKYEVFPHFPTERGRNAFVYFVHELLNRRPRSDIEKFSFSADSAIDVTSLLSFVVQALQCNVQTLEISYSNEAYDKYKRRIYLDHFELPHIVFTSKSLHVLKLAGNGRSITFPSTVRFIGLKELHLRNISLSEIAINGYIMPPCPNLEHLSLLSCDFSELQSLKITAPRLTHLDISSPKLEYGNLESPERFKFAVSAPNLSCFRYSSHLPLVWYMGNPLNINTVDIDIQKLDKKRKTKKYKRALSCQLFAMLREFQHAKSVTLSLRAIKILSEDSCYIDFNKPLFTNLKNFKLNATRSWFTRGLSYVLQDSPHAKTRQMEASFRFPIEDKWLRSW